MKEKNIIFNQNIEKYKKKYSNRQYRLLKITKKQVEDFDKLHNTEEGYLLKGRKWCLIKDTYYEIPKPIRFTWLRNLNAGIQTGVCLLGAGVVTTAITVPLVLMNQNKVEEPSITIQGADFDKSASHIELNKQSTIKLKEQSGKAISDVEEVKVGGKVITRDTDWTYDKTNKKVTIKAEAMTSTKIEIKVKIGGEPTVIKVTSVEITNTVTEVKAGEKIELTTKVLPENATNKELDWSMNGGGSEYAEFVVEGGKTYLKGKTAGQIGITATTKDGSGKSDSKSFTVKENVTTKADFIKAYKDLRTKFNTETTKTYKPSQIKVNSWNGEYFFGAAKTLSDLTYDTTSNRSAIFKFKDNGGNEQSHEFGTNLLSDNDLDTLLKSETESTVTYTINDNYIQYSKTALPGEKGLYDLTVNKDGYIISYSINTDDKDEEFSLNINGEPEVYYNIDWATTSFELVSKQSKTLYEYARTATKIEFVEDPSTSGVCVGQDSSGAGQEPVYASFKTEGEEKTLRVWSAGKIRFTDDDHGNDGFFYCCDTVTEFDFSNIDTSKVTNFSQSFSGCKFNKLDLSYFDTSSGVDMSLMFNACEDLTSIDLSNFITSKVTNMEAMFYNCSSLEKIYVSEKFITDNVQESDAMFEYCEVLVGGKGTVYDSEHLTCEYARIDDPENGKPGYFTDAKELPTSDSWFKFTPIEENTAYSVRLTDSGSGEIPTNFVIPSTHKGDDGIELPVTQIESNAFTSIDNPVSLLVIPSSITSIGTNSFDNSFIDENTDIRFKDTTHTWTIKNINETTIETDFDPSKEESKVSVVAYLTAGYTWSKNIETSYELEYLGEMMYQHKFNSGVKAQQYILTLTIDNEDDDGIDSFCFYYDDQSDDEAYVPMDPNNTTVYINDILNTNWSLIESNNILRFNSAIKDKGAKIKIITTTTGETTKEVDANAYLYEEP